jgi:hypothetical protein
VAVSGRTGLEVWQLEVDGLASCGPMSDELRTALAWAILAPSSHNSQPWLFEIQADSVHVVADRTRALPVVDPHDRELTISVAAAAATLAAALRGMGWATGVHWLPDPADPDLVARVTPRQRTTPDPVDRERFAAITARCTNRGPFHDEPVPAGLLELLALDAAAEGAHVGFVEGADRLVVADLVAQADLLQMDDRRFRRELAAWTAANRSHRLDGLRGYGLGVGDFASNFGPLVIRTFDLGRGQAARDADLAEGSPALALIATPGDEPRDWATAGAALVPSLLRLTHDGFAASFLNQPIEVSPLREELARLSGIDGVPQLLLRLGRPQRPFEHTPRRPVPEVLVGESRWHHGMPDTAST